MAKSILNVVMQGASGKIGKTLVFRQTRNGETVIAIRGKKRSTPPTAKEEAVRERFKEAAYTSKMLVKDPIYGPVYRAMAKKQGKTAYILAMKDCLTGSYDGKGKMGNGKRAEKDGKWEMGNGKCAEKNGEWEMENGKCAEYYGRLNLRTTKHGKWKRVNGRCGELRYPDNLPINFELMVRSGMTFTNTKRQKVPIKRMFADRLHPGLL